MASVTTEDAQKRLSEIFEGVKIVNNPDIPQKPKGEFFVFQSGKKAAEFMLRSINSINYQNGSQEVGAMILPQEINEGAKDSYKEDVTAPWTVYLRVRTVRDNPRFLDDLESKKDNIIEANKGMQGKEKKPKENGEDVSEEGGKKKGKTTKEGGRGAS